MESRYGLRKVRACDGERRIYLSVRKTKKPHDVGNADQLRNNLTIG
tara:strand:+ start:338 stop:475 length:138 start_codon:yes stop_codon:yes gene_type:complete